VLEFIPALHRAVNAVQVLLADERIDVTHAEALVLAQLAEAKVQRMSELRNAFGQRKSTLTSVADRLVERGLITRYDDPQDRRVLLVRLTRAGERSARRIVTVLSALEKRAIKAAEPCDVQTLRRGLEAIGDAAPRSRRGK
jgi:DNA-binding MarR family transcriptional regulator